ncbi:class I SAM-dependent methyltransferase [Gracilibacillus dipsosauri]|uniref:SAM-dependent methyltransferase n=1 Tax=Gracilibacillus dipsosauri TaxID=178340 RepID=A0A317L446_9BACI|nr:class I SAM-dependent methyltransferase [Gracilibacillus dipsosauri]PWU70034.1 SAM-dependent methyltransferase [Gracilibacillus dipsosauri]
MSYHASNANIGWEAEVNRLKAQALMGWEKEYKHLIWHGLTDGMNVLEVGSGPGFVTEKLLENLPNSSITALDIDEKLITKAKQALHPNPRLTFMKASVYDTGLPNDSYDFVIARLLFLHLSEPKRAAREIYRVLKPGGKLVILDVDDGVFGVVEPNIENLSTIVQKLIDVQAQAGGNREIGRSLPRLLAKAGFSDIDMDAVTVHSDLVGLEGFKEQFNPKRFERLYKNGILSEAEFRSIEEAHKNLVRDPEAYAMMIFQLASGRKPY